MVVNGRDGKEDTDGQEEAKEIPLSCPNVCARSDIGQRNHPIGFNDREIFASLCARDYIVAL